MKKTIVISAVIGLLVLVEFFAAAIYFFVFPVKYKAEIEKFSSKYEIEAALVFAVVKAESDFDRFEVSTKGAIGLAQIMPSTAEYLEENYFKGRTFDLFCPSDNVELCCFYLRYLIDRFGSAAAAVAAYNAGEGNVSSWIESSGETSFSVNDVRFPETKRYIRRVLLFKRVYSLKFL